MKRAILTVFTAIALSSCGPNADQQRRQIEYDAAVKDVKGCLKFPHTVRIATLTSENTDSCRVDHVTDRLDLVAFDYHAENGLGNFVPDVARALVSHDGKVRELYVEQSEWKESGSAYGPEMDPGGYYLVSGHYRTWFTRDSIIKLQKLAQASSN